MIPLFPLFCAACAISAVLAAPRPNILLFTATAGFRHDSIPTAVEALQAKSDALNVKFTHTEDKSLFNEVDLARYDALIFLSNTGEVLDGTGKAAFQSWLNKGGNFVGIHSASDCLNTTTFYGKEIGAYFDYHPELQNATVNVIGPSHPSTGGLPKQWHIADEMYNFKSDPRAVGATVLLSVDESSYEDAGQRNFEQGSPHPTAWFQEHGAGVQDSYIAGRSFYTSLGHLNETWKDETFMSHILGGISWALASNTTRAFNASGIVGAGDEDLQTGTGASDTGSSETRSATTSSILTLGSLLAMIANILLELV
jgi:type 1 glutamine amidotransferase